MQCHVRVSGLHLRSCLLVDSNPSPFSETPDRKMQLATQEIKSLGDELCVERVVLLMVPEIVYRVGDVQPAESMSMALDP